MFASSSLTEEGVEGVISSSDGLVAGHLTIWLDAMLQAVELPACIAYLSSSLANMDRDTFTLQEQVVQMSRTSSTQIFSHKFFWEKILVLGEKKVHPNRQH